MRRPPPASSASAETRSRAPAPPSSGLNGGRFRRLLCRPAFNRPLTFAVRPFAGLLSQDTLVRVPVVGAVEVRVPGVGPVSMDSDGSDVIAAMLFWRGVDGWEPTTLSVFAALVSNQSRVLDIGANTGLFSLLAGRRAPSVEVHAFEPVPGVFARLEANVVRNRLSNVSCHRLAMSDRSGAAVLHVPRDQPVPMMASLVEGWSPHVDREPVDCSTVDEFLARSPSNGPVDVIKIDAEGSEEAVVRGAGATITDHRPHVICEVLTRGDQARGLTSALGAHGYRFFAIAGDGLDPRPGIEAGIDDDETHNFLCVHRDRVPDMAAALRDRLPSAHLSRWRVWSLPKVCE